MLKYMFNVSNTILILNKWIPLLNANSVKKNKKEKHLTFTFFNIHTSLFSICHWDRLCIVWKVLLWSLLHNRIWKYDKRERAGNKNGRNYDEHWGSGMDLE